jgi:hypothetical protein
MMSLFSYSWTTSINNKPIKIEASARSVEHARRGVLSILTARNADPSRRGTPKHSSRKAKKTWAQMTSTVSEQEQITEKIHEEQTQFDKQMAENSSPYAVQASDFTADTFVGYLDDHQTLGEFIQTTEPSFGGPTDTKVPSAWFSWLD